MLKNKIDEKNDYSDWNMGVGFYQQLEDLKKMHIESFAMGYFKEAVIFLASELDWVSTDIGKEKLESLRGEIDNLLSQVVNDKDGKKTFYRKIIDVRRKIWDEEMSNNITRPKNQLDLSNTPIAFINKR